MHDLCFVAPSPHDKRTDLFQATVKDPTSTSTTTHTYTILFIQRRFAEQAELCFVFTHVHIWELPSAATVSYSRLLNSSSAAAENWASVFPDHSTVLKPVVTQLLLVKHHIYDNAQKNIICGTNKLAHKFKVTNHSSITGNTASVPGIGEAFQTVY